MTWIILEFVIFVAIVLIGRAHSRYLDRQEDIGRICQALENHAATQLGFMVKELNDRNQGQALVAAQTPETTNGLTLFQAKRDEERAKPGISARRGRQGGDDGWRPNRDAPERRRPSVASHQRARRHRQVVRPRGSQPRPE